MRTYAEELWHLNTKCFTVHEIKSYADNDAFVGNLPMISQEYYYTCLTTAQDMLLHMLNIGMVLSMLLVLKEIV